MRIAIATLVACVVSGCASTPPERGAAEPLTSHAPAETSGAVAAIAAGRETVCGVERPTGSRLHRQVCRTWVERTRDRGDPSRYPLEALQDDPRLVIH